MNGHKLYLTLVGLYTESPTQYVAYIDTGLRFRYARTRHA